MNPKIQKIIDHMNSNLHRKLTLSGLAGSVKLSRSRMCYLFRTETGTSPGQYLKTLRIQTAAALLTSTSLTIGQIRAKVGIKDKSYFLQAFKAKYGLTPSAYRARSKLDRDL
jgi:transcriptional regulator GlxA family with amidase domain